MKLYNKDELKDSRIFFDKNSPRFMTVFILFIACCIVFVGFISIKINKSYIIIANGTATTTDNRYISINKNGEIVEVIKKEGDYVKKGDTLFKISDGKNNLQATSFQPQIDNLKGKLNALDTYEKSLEDRINYLENFGQEQAFFGKLEYYLSTLKSELYTKDQQKKKVDDANNKLNELQTTKQELQTQLNNLTEEEINKGKKDGILTKIESKNNEIDTKKSEINELTSQTSNPSSQSEQVYQQLFSELGTERSNTTLQLSQLEGQQKVYESDGSLKSIKSENDGILHYLITFKTGIPLQVNQTVAEISKNEASTFVVEANIMAKDISKIKIGQDVNVKLQGVNTQKFGTLKGKIEKISSGTFVEQTQQGNIVYYQCIIVLDSTQLKASNGDMVSIVKSMPVQARIIYNSESYYDWMRELVNLKN